MSFANLWFYFFSPEEKIRQLEKKVNELIEESCFANSRGELPLVNTMFILHVCVFVCVWGEVV